MDEETTKVAKLNRMNFLKETLEKYTTTIPELSLEDIAEVLVWQLPDLTEFLKTYKKLRKRDTKNL